MTFVRTKVLRGKPYLYLVENKRVAGKVKQKVLLYIGRYESAEEAVGCWEAGTSWTQNQDKWGRKKGTRRRTYTNSEVAAENVKLIRSYVDLDEAAVVAERTEALVWKNTADAKMKSIFGTNWEEAL